MERIQHHCSKDDRGLCEVCESSIRQHDHEGIGRTIQEIMADRIPNNFEFPDPYEMGLMESGEWN